MSYEFIICLILLFSLSAIGTPIAYAIFVGACAYLWVGGQGIGLAGKVILDGLYSSFILLAVPLFIVAANIMNAGTISDRLLSFCVAVVGRFKGGLGHVNVVASIIFSGMSGSAVADAAGIGKIIINMMVKSGHYTRGYAAAITAASATIGPIIPPSIPMVLYALVSNSSIGYLFLGGIIPGILMGAVLMAMNSLIAIKRGYEPEESVPLHELPPTEAAAVAAFYALILASIFYRALSFSNFYRILVESARSSAAVGLVIGGALILNYIVASENIPDIIAGYLVGLDVSPLLFLIGVNILILLLGCILDATTLILVIIPLFLPSCRELGIDFVHFGVVAVVNCMIGLITPPYGVLLFVINAVSRIPLGEIIKEVIPFLFVLIIALFMMVSIPDLVLWLPRQFGYEG